MIRERPPHSSVVALLEAEGLPASIQSTHEFASLCPSSSAFMIKRLHVHMRVQ